MSGADWGPDGESLAVVRAVGGKFRLEYPIGTVLYETEKRPSMMPRVSSDGKLVAFFDFDVEVGDYALCIIGPNHPSQVLIPRMARHRSFELVYPDNREVWFSGGQPGSDPATLRGYALGRSAVGLTDRRNDRDARRSPRRTRSAKHGEFASGHFVCAAERRTTTRSGVA